MSSITKRHASWSATSTSSSCQHSKPAIWCNEGKRKIRSKSVRSMLTFAHYRFQQFLLWKAWETGKQVLLVKRGIHLQDLQLER